MRTTAEEDCPDVACAVGESSVIILLHHPLPLVGVSIAKERERQQNDKVFVRGRALPPAALKSAAASFIEPNDACLITRATTSSGASSPRNAACSRRSPPVIVSVLHMLRERAVRACCESMLWCVFGWHGQRCVSPQRVAAGE